MRTGLCSRSAAVNAWSDDARVDFAYEHIFHHTGAIDTGSGSGDLLIRNSQLSADIFAAQLTLKY